MCDNATVSDVTVCESLYQCILDCVEKEGATIPIKQSLNGMSESLILAFVQAITASPLEHPGQADQLKDMLLKIFQFCVKKDFSDEKVKDNTYYVLTMNILQNFVFKNKHHVETIRPFMPYVKQLWKGNNKTLAEIAGTIINDITDGEVLGDAVTQLIEDYFQGKGQIQSFPSMYPNSKEKFDPYLKRFAERLSMEVPTYERTFILKLLHVGIRTNPKLSQIFTQKMILQIAHILDDEQADILAATVLNLLAPHKPRKIIQVLDKMIDFADKKGKTFMRSDVGDTIAVVIKEKKELLEKYLKVLVRWTEDMEPESRPGLVPHFKTLCPLNPQALKPYKEFFEGLKDDLRIKRTVTWCVGFLEGERWYSTRVEDTSVELEKTEEKSLKHVPQWVYDVASLLDQNIPKENDSTNEPDWGKLAKNLDYTEDDITDWATHSNPCLRMLEEWFTVDRTREDIQGLLQQLHTLKRLDAKCIVQYALQTKSMIAE